MEVIMENYIKHCRAKGLSEQTIKTYEVGLGYLQRFLDKENIDLKDLNIDDLILYVNDGKRTVSSARSVLGSIRGYLYYEMEQGNLDPFEFKLPKPDKTIKDIYSEGELKKLLKKPLKKEGFTPYKIWVLENYLLGTGNRLGSTLNIKIKDVNLSDGMILLTKTKNHKQQLVPLTQSLKDILVDYMDIRGGSDNDYLFCNACGDKADRRTYQQQIQRYNKHRGVTKTSAHLFRHTFATMYIKNGGDVYRLSKLLGHSGVGITENYIQELPVTYLTKTDSYNPLESLIWHEKIRMK